MDRTEPMNTGSLNRWEAPFFAMDLAINYMLSIAIPKEVTESKMADMMLALNSKLSKPLLDLYASPPLPPSATPSPPPDLA